MTDARADQPAADVVQRSASEYVAPMLTDLGTFQEMTQGLGETNPDGLEFQS